ncbi:Calcium-transporting ATPase 1, chloroplastic [Capsicum baccatum]|uniref:Calcium-transporting ATPase 1, chloroplastic n=1 Tax=Capsicum baccatum TaxID=33114 RepID=A0A2G2V7U3_CAPBA|nr:Calcium-transporting ATPase 1, chloroplastic [Capsicum baccatum]
MSIDGGRFYWKRNLNEKVKEIVIIFAWILIEESELKNHVHLYASLGWNSLVSIKIVRGMKKYRDVAMIEVEMLQQLGKQDSGGNQIEVALGNFSEICSYPLLYQWFNDVFSTDISDKCENILSRLSESMDAMCIYLFFDLELQELLESIFALEIVLAACDKVINSSGEVVPLDETSTNHLKTTIDQFASEPLCTLCLGYIELEKGFSPATDIPVFGYTCIGIVGIKDPICLSVREFVVLCHSAGVNVRMVTVHNLLSDCQPVFDKRNDIIKTIPDFWLTDFLSHPILGELLTEEDLKNFNSNSYFENTKLHDDITVIVMYLDRPERPTNAGSNIVKGTNNPLDIYSLNSGHQGENASYVSP